MSIEVSQNDIAHVYSVLEREHNQDWALIAGAFMEAEHEDSPTDGAFVEELADRRWQQALGYDYPVSKTGPTRPSSLRIVHDIMAIRALEGTVGQRREAIALHGTDIMLAGAYGLERSHRLWEKGVLRIFDQRIGRSMWSVEFDRSRKIGELPPEQRVGAMTARLFLEHRESA